MNDLKKEIRNLTARIRILEEENQALSERSEDIMLIGLVAENFSLIHSPEDIIDRLLERIAILKKIPFCACCQVNGTELTIQQHYTTIPLAIKTGQRILLKPEVFLQMTMGLVILSQEDISEKVEKLPFSQTKLSPQYIALIPFESRIVKNGIMVFIDDNPLGKQLSQFSLLLQRIIDITVSKLDSLSLFRELNQLNDELDRRVELRTEELRKLNKELQTEVETRKAAENQLMEDQKILDTLNRAQSRFFTQEEHSTVMKGLLDDILTMDGSTLGFIAEAKVGENDVTTMTNYVLSAPDSDLSAYEAAPMRAFDRTTIFGKSILDQEPFFTDEINKEIQCNELPASHPKIQSFAGIPVIVDGSVIAYIGLGNNPRGYDKSTLFKLDPFITVIGNFVKTFQIEIARESTAQSLGREKIKLSEIFDNAPEAIILTDTDECILQVNRGFSQLFGYSSKEAQGKKISALIGEPITEEREVLNQAKASKSTTHVEALHHRKDGSEVFVSVIWSPIEFSDGQSNALYFIRDITEQRMVQNTLYEIAEGLLATEGDAFLHNTVTYLTDLFNVDYAFISDLSNPDSDTFQTIALSHRNAIVENFNCNNVDICQRVIREGKAIIQQGVLQQFPNDKQLHEFGIESYLGMLLTDSDKKPMGILGVMSTRPAENTELVEQIMKIVSVRITAELERRVRRKEAEEMQSALRHSQKMESMGRIAGGVAHDFNNILASMMGYAEFLSSLKTDPESSEGKAIDAILRGTERASQLTKQLLGFARKTQFKLNTVSVNSMIQETLKVSEKIFEKRIDLHVELNPKCWNVLADKNQIDQVLTNLFINARDAMPDGGQLHIRTDNEVLDKTYIQEIRGLKSGRYVKISVTDTGIGISEDVLEKIFEPFFTTKGEGLGTGLGLSVVYGIMRAHHGQITCYSEPGHGTTFNLYLPASDEAVKEKIVDTHLEKGTERILVVEDEEDIREVIKMQLENLGYSVILAENGFQAVEIYKKNEGRFDLVLFDLVMPGMNGIETYENLVQINPQVRCILMSGYSKDTRAADLFQSGKVGFLQKPFRLHELTQTIQRYLH
ncbi:MAG: response regulator [FCB group bacterium]|nr:response regulator [FCB group bacterium]